MRRRKGKKRKVKTRILIMCEGETERNYFQAIKEDEEYKQKLAAINPQVLTAKHSAPELVVEEAMRREKKEKKNGNPYDKIWVVFDHDNHPNRKKAFDNSKKEGFSIAFSAIAFEIWFLVHFGKKAPIFSTPKQLVKELNKHYPNYQKA